MADYCSHFFLLVQESSHEHVSEKARQKKFFACFGEAIIGEASVRVID